MGELEKYRMLFDYHTHTVYSHGKGSIEDNVLIARQKGLEAVAISDHGPGHLTYGIKKSKIGEMRATIDELNKKYDDIHIYLSVEANVVSSGSCLDISPEEARLFDFVLGGYHYGVTHGYCIANWTLSHNLLASDGRRSRQFVRNTEMAVKAVYENKMKIFTHPGDKGDFDIYELAVACEATDTWMEINSRHRNLTVEEIKLAAARDVKFVIGSDAHTPEAVGSFMGGLKRAEAAGLDFSRIVNIGEK